MFSGSVMSNSPWPRGLQHARLPCPSPSAGVCSNSCPLSRWCHPTISSCPPSFPASGYFPGSQLFTSGGQSIGASASASVHPMSIWRWFPLVLTGLISLQSKRLSRVFFNTTVWKHEFLGTQPSLWSNSHTAPAAPSTPPTQFSVSHSLRLSYLGKKEGDIRHIYGLSFKRRSQGTERNGEVGSWINDGEKLQCRFSRVQMGRSLGPSRR